MKKKKATTFRKILFGTPAVFTVLSLIARKKKHDSVYGDDLNQRNPLEGKRVIFVANSEEEENADGARGHLEAIGQSSRYTSGYQRFIKRGIDIALSFAGLVILSPVLGAISLAIKIDDPGPVLFTQKRIGENKQYFKLHKFRSMKMSTPHDVPTHMLDNPNQYITKVGKFLREHSLDELPQIWDIFIGNMSIIGPRPGLWNQDVLTAERDKYGANDIKPGLTGWAQINGRDELELTEKARLDGDYVAQINKGGMNAFLFDCKCFIGTIFSVARSEGVVEGGTGAMQHALRSGVPAYDPETPLGCDLSLSVDKDAKKKVLITGAGSYIGESVRSYAAEHYPLIDIEAIDMIDGIWRDFNFAGFDCVYHVAGIAHADVGNVSDDVKEQYYKVNTDLAIEVANKAKHEGVKQFIFMSSMIVYGDSAPYGKTKRIGRNTNPSPDNFYGDSKWQADKGIRALADDNFKVAVLRPPMIYGRGSKGNYPTLAKMAKKLPLFPYVNNERSMLYIENLCEFICNLILCGEGGIFFPQNDEYTRTSEMVREIAKASGHRIFVSKLLNPVIAITTKMPCKIGRLADKAFGSLSYEQELSRYGFNYRLFDLHKSIEQTEMLACANKQIQKICIVNCFDTYEKRVDLLHDFFKSKGWSVSVYTSDYRHIEKCKRNDYKEDYFFFEAFPYKKNISLKRIHSHISLSKHIMKEVKLNNFDLVWILVPPNSFVKEFASYKRLNPKVKIVFDLIDLWPETMPVPSMYKRTLLFKYWKHLRNYNLNVADAIVTECNLYKDELPEALKDITNTIYLAKPHSEKKIETNKPILKEDRVSLCYLGSINNIIDIEFIENLISKIVQIKPVDLHIIGDGENRKQLISKCKAAGATVLYHGKIYDEKVKQEIYNSCHYGLNIMKESVFVGVTMKSLDYFEAGLPLINNIQGDTWDIIETFNSGYNVDLTDANISTLCDYDINMRAYTRKVFETQFTEAAFKEKVENVLSIVGRY